jgi:DNA polymerase-3 subunit beta
MRLSIDRSVFLKALSHVQSVVERRAVTPILANVLLEAEGKTLSLTATDLDISVREISEANIGEPGALTVNAHTLHEVTKKLPDGSEIELSSNEDLSQLFIKCGRSRFQLSTLAAADFPDVKVSSLPHEFSLTAEEVRHLVNQTRFAMSSEEARYYLNGIYLHTKQTDKGSVLRAVATDGHRLAQAEIPQPEGAEGMPGVIIPRKTVGELSRLLENTTDEVHLALSLTQISFSFAGIQLISRLIDGSFPDYEKVIPQTNKLELTLELKKFAEAVDRVAVLSQEKSRGVKVSIENNRVTVSAVSPDQGSAVEEVEAAYEGNKIETGFNARYLLDIAQQIETDHVQFLLDKESAPAIIRGVGEEDALYVLMPMRV